MMRATPHALGAYRRSTHTPLASSSATLAPARDDENQVTTTTSYAAWAEHHRRCHRQNAMTWSSN